MGEGLTKWLELNGVSTDTLKLLLGCAVVVALVIVIAAIFSKVRSAQREDLFRVQKLEAMESFNRLEKTGKLPATQTNIILQKGEVALLDEPTTFCEARSYRVGGGAGTRIGGVYIGGGV